MTTAEETKTAQIYEQRARRLAERRMAAPEAGATRIPVLVFSLGGERHAIALDRVAQVIAVDALIEVPGAPVEVMGLLAVKGELQVVMSLSALLGSQRSHGPSETTRGYALLLAQPGARAGLWVERVIGVELVDPPEKTPSGEGPAGAAVLSWYLRPQPGEAVTYVAFNPVFENQLFGRA